MRLKVGLWAALALALGAASPAAAQNGACNRACLQGVLDAYLSAVIRHDPAQAPLAANYRATENAVATPAGQGLWKTAAGLGSTQRRYFDTTNGTAAFFGILDEKVEGGGTQQVITSVAIIVRGGKVTGAEWVYGRPSAPIYFPAGLGLEPPNPEPPPAANRRDSRETLTKVVNAYFDGIQQHNSDLVLNHKGCVRLENGTHMAGPFPPNVPNRIPVPAAGAAPIVTAAERRGEPQDCGNGMETMARTTEAVTSRHFPVLDEVAGVALGGGIFIRLPGLTTPPRLLLQEYFVIRDGKISSIFAAMDYLPAAAPSLTGWENETYK